MNPALKPSFLFLSFVLSVFAVGTVTAKETPFEGQWRINQEETDKVRVAFKEGSGIKTGPNLRPNISVGGLPLPRAARSRPLSSLSAKDPEVLRCTTMQISSEGERVKLVYDGASKETLVMGKYRGRKTSLSSKKMQQTYKTTERTVKKTWTLREDGRLEVAVKVNPKGDRARTHKRVFDRFTAEAQPDVTTAAEAETPS